MDLILLLPAQIFIMKGSKKMASITKNLNVLPEYFIFIYRDMQYGLQNIKYI